MKPAKWRDLSDDEIRQKVRELTEEVFNLRFQLSMGVAKNPSRLSQARRDVARALTVLREQDATREQSAHVAPGPARPVEAPAAIGAAIAAVTEPTASKAAKKAPAKSKATASTRSKSKTKTMTTSKKRA